MMLYVQHWVWYENVFPKNPFDVFSNFKYDQPCLKLKCQLSDKITKQ